jgi:hypothetical protein
LSQQALVLENINYICSLRIKRQLTSLIRYAQVFSFPISFSAGAPCAGRPDIRCKEFEREAEYNEKYMRGSQYNPEAFEMVRRVEENTRKMYEQLEERRKAEQK